MNDQSKRRGVSEEEREKRENLAARGDSHSSLLTPHSSIRVGVLGATGAVGQRFVQMLQGHPWFEISVLCASERNVGKRYEDACNWLLRGDMPPHLRDCILQEMTPGIDCQLAFSALPSGPARTIEAELAAAGYIVCSNASAFRYEPDVPLLIPEVNPEHVGLIELQRRQRGWQGFITTNPNCSTTHLVSALHPLHEAFGIEKVFVVTMQAVSGAGYPGVPSMDVIDNVIPFINGEEEKMERREPQKLLGRFDRPGCAVGRFRCQRPLQPRAGAQRPSGRGSVWSSRAALVWRMCGGRGRSTIPCPSVWAYPARPTRRSSTGRRRTGRSRAWTGWPAASPAWRRSSAGCGATRSCM